MIYLVFLGGVIFGSIVTNIIIHKRKTHGVLRIDHVNETCQVLLNTDEIMDRSKNKVVLDVVHNANISQK